MKLRSSAKPTVSMIYAAACLLGLALSSCKEPEPISVAAPPAWKTEQDNTTYDYKHSLRAKPGFRRPVVALLRPGDTQRLRDYVPFGRGTVIIQTRDGNRNQIEIKPGTADMPVLTTAAQRQFLMRELVKSREFLLVERERIFEVIRELDFGETKYVDKQSKPKLGQLIGVHYILEAAFFPAGSPAAADSIWAEMTNSARRRRGGIDPARNATVYVSAYDVQTGHVVAVAFGAGANDAFATRSAVQDLIDQFADVEVPIRVMRLDKDGRIVLDIGASEGVKPGDKFEVTASDGTATVKVASTKPLSSTATVVSDKPVTISPGDLARPQPPQADTPKPE